MATDAATANHTAHLAATQHGDADDDDNALNAQQQHRQHLEQEQQHQDRLYLSLAPTFLLLHHEASASTQLLDSLHSFLSTFQSDLSSLSSHISALQTTSHHIDTRLHARRQIESHLALFLSEISLSPRVVDLFSHTEPESKVELWKKAVRQLERVLEATKTGASPFLHTDGDDQSNKQDATLQHKEYQAVKEAREVAQTCKNIVAVKLRAFLLSPYAAIRSSVTTNLQVLQTSILLQHHHPFYAFLARQMPRVAIDVQRIYVAAARLYFETAFRRYARSFGVIQARWNETAGGLITDPTSSSSSSSTAAAAGSALGSAGNAGAAAMAFLSRPTSSASQPTAKGSATGPADPWELDVARLENAKLDGPSIVLGYMADEASFRASPESLFRSISLVMVDNSCSEYTFLVRFFENLQDESVVIAPGGSGGERTAPDESASVNEEGVEEAETETEPEPSVVQLSRSEQRQMKGRGASDEIFKQVLEPAISTWSTFTKSLLTPIPPLLSLLSMLRLNDTLLQLISRRGCSTPLLETALMGFKIAAYPILKRQLDERIDAVRKVNGSGGKSGDGGGGMKGLFWGAVGGAVTGEKGEVERIVASRYAALYTRMVYLFEEEEDDGLFANLLRLRIEVEKLLGSPSSPGGLYEIVLRGLENGPASLSLPRIQAELSHWNELLRSK